MTIKRYNLLDIIKGLMIMFIIITHFRFVYPDDYMKYGFFYWIDMAVPVFMIITGYLNALNLEKISLAQSLSIETITTKAARFIIPWFPVLLFEIFFQVISGKFTVFDMVKNIIGGGTDLDHIIPQ